MSPHTCFPPVPRGPMGLTMSPYTCSPSVPRGPMGADNVTSYMRPFSTMRPHGGWQCHLIHSPLQYRVAPWGLTMPPYTLSTSAPRGPMGADNATLYTLPFRTERCHNQKSTTLVYQVSLPSISQSLFKETERNLLASNPIQSIFQLRRRDWKVYLRRMQWKMNTSYTIWR